MQQLIDEIERIYGDRILDRLQEQLAGLYDNWEMSDNGLEFPPFFYQLWDEISKILDAEL